MPRSFLIGFLVFLFSQLCFADGRVQNGDSVPDGHALTRTVAILKNASGGICSASFLTKKVLVTAGHCTAGVAASKATVRVKDLTGAFYAVRVAKLSTHPKFAVTELNPGVRVNYDVGVIHLAQEFPFPIRTVKIANVGGMSVTPEIVTVVGYGKNTKNGGSRVLRVGSMLANVEPVDLLNGRSGLYMTPEGGQMLCPGDSGGAVFRGGESSRELIGINSLSNGCGNGPGTISISEIAINHKPWIKSVAPEIP